MRRMTAYFVAALLALGSVWASAAQNENNVVVFAAASLTDALNEIGTAFAKDSHVQITPSYAASSALAKQIEAGAPAGVFFAADEEWMDYLDQKQLLAPGTRKDVLANKLVLIAPADSKAKIKITTGPAFIEAIGDARIATGDPDSVPVGKYAKAALTSLGAWEAIAPKLVRGENVRAALAYVARGEAPFGIVYLTDAKIEKNVKLLDTFPEKSHNPIRYPVAVTAKGDDNAKQFVAFLSSRPAGAIFKKYGFELVH